MSALRLVYSVGNEHSPTDPWGRSELVVEAGGAVRLDHHYSGFRGDAAWVGVVAGATLDDVWAALDRSDFPAGPSRPVVPGTRMGHLTVDGTTVLVIPGAPGYVDLVDVLHGIIERLSGGDVTYTGKHTAVVSGARRV